MHVYIQTWLHVHNAHDTDVYMRICTCEYVSVLCVAIHEISWCHTMKCRNHMGVSLNGGTPISHPKGWSFLVGKPMVVGETHHFRVHPDMTTVHASTGTLAAQPVHLAGFGAQHLGQRCLWSSLTFASTLVPWHYHASHINLDLYNLHG